MHLEKQGFPEILKNFSQKELEELSQEIRDLMINTCAENGGHLGPSLGVVELTIALHTVFDSPSDAIIWDIGHQAYPHKILTGRVSEFNTIRRQDGISGFLKRDESKHDIFGGGHAATALSVAMGVAIGKKRNGKCGKVIPVIGDGSMTCGLAFEGLNHIGHSGDSNLIVVLNDNEMSISKNVGALSEYFSKHLRERVSSRVYNIVRNNFKHFVDSVSDSASISLSDVSNRIRLGLKSMLLPQNIFEALGFRYVGPIDGHDLPELINTLTNLNSVVESEKPVLLHVITKKGKGYIHAEENPSKFHGIGAFNSESGESIKKTGVKTYTEAFSDTMLKLAEEDSRIVAITAAMKDGTGLTKFSEKYKERFFDVGIAEGHAVTFSGGLTLEGLKPVVAIYSSFLQRAFDNIFHDICIQNLPVIFAIDRAGLVGEDGPTHHGVYDLSYLRCLPNMTIMAPRDSEMLDKCFREAAKLNSPVAIRYPRGYVPYEIASKEKLSVNGECLFGELNSKNEAVIIAVGKTVFEAIEAAKILTSKGVRVAVVDPIFVKPISEEMIVKVLTCTKNIVTLEDNVKQGGFGAGVLEILSKLNVHPNVATLGVPDELIIHSSQREQYKMCKIDSNEIIKSIEVLREVNSNCTFYN